MATKSFRVSLRKLILTLAPEEWIKLTTPCIIMYQEPFCETAHPVKITEVGRWGARGQAKLVDEFNQMFCLSEATESECAEILTTLNANHHDKN